MKQLKNLQQLSQLSYFDTGAISQVTQVEGNALYKNIARWVEQGYLIKLKNGVFTTKEYYQQLNDPTAYLEFISNQLRFPSYLSLEYVLSQYQILTQSVYAITAITQKSTRSYTNSLGRFIYQSISQKLFTGYTISQNNNFAVAKATKAKALFDYLYLNFFRAAAINQEMLESLRLNLDDFSQQDRDEFAQYCQITKIAKFMTLALFL